MAAPPLQVLFEDNHCLALLKPAGLLSMGDATGDVSAVDLARDYLREKYDKPGNVFVGVVHRLDRPVSGVLLFARTSKAASRLSEQFRKHSTRKVYHAVVEGRPPQKQGELVDWLVKSEASNVSRVAKQNLGAHERDHADGSKESRLTYQCLKTSAGISLLEIDLQTGRSHQIRVQLSSRDMPICGDTKYGSKSRLDGWLALHAASLTFEHPTRQESITVTAPHPTNWDRFRLTKTASSQEVSSQKR